ncbi:MAG TPA: carboxypeptidase-like regulatory domain-containing protein, partial [Longimicrobiaceae bacterium]|nr:carboxypeptidase-like regulatory domain-containing protein [Longimicrobiaceae bacterium]
MACWKILVLVAGLLLAGRSAAAQAVRGDLLEGASGRPVAGAFVVLLDGAGKQVGGGFTDAAGAFLVQAPGPGSYTLRAERVGFAAVRSPVLRLAAGQTVTHGLETGSEAVKLEGLVVRAEKRRCAALPEAGEATAALWEEARKALGAAAWTESRRRFRYTIQRHVRTMDVALRVQSEEGQRLTGFAGSPFVSVPAERLAREGFARQEG